MSPQTSPNSAKVKPQEPLQQEPRSEEAVTLNPRRKSAGTPLVRSDTASPHASGSGDRVTYPGLGKVTIVLH